MKSHLEQVDEIVRSELCILTGKLGYNIADIGKICGVSKDTISNVISGKHGGVRKSVQSKIRKGLALIDKTKEPSETMSELEVRSILNDLMDSFNSMPNGKRSILADVARSMVTAGDYKKKYEKLLAKVQSITGE